MNDNISEDQGQDHSSIDIDYGSYYQSSCNQLSKSRTAIVGGKYGSVDAAAAADAANRYGGNDNSSSSLRNDDAIDDDNDNDGVWSSFVTEESELLHPATVSGRNKLYRRRLVWFGSAAVAFYACNAIYSGFSGSSSYYSTGITITSKALVGTSSATTYESDGSFGSASTSASTSTIGTVTTSSEQIPSSLSFVPTTYLGCPAGVEMKYVSEKLTFEEHEEAAVASQCHLASIHSSTEDHYLSIQEFFQLSTGTEIGTAVMGSGRTTLEKTFWLGGYLNFDESDWEGDESWSWTDGSPWDYDPDDYLSSNATTSTTLTSLLCLSSMVDYNSTDAQLSLKEDLPTTTGNWIPTDCEQSLPAIYKCCIPTPSPTPYPTVTLSKEPSEDPSASPTPAPSPAPTISSEPSQSPSETASAAPTASPSAAPSFVPTSSPSSAPSFVPTASPSTSPSSAHTSTPSGRPSFLPTDVPTFSPTNISSMPTASADADADADDAVAVSDAQGDEATDPSAPSSKPTNSWDVDVNKYKNQYTEDDYTSDSGDDDDDDDDEEDQKHKEKKHKKKKHEKKKHKKKKKDKKKKHKKKKERN